MTTVNPTGKHRRKRRHHGEGTVVLRSGHWRAKPWAAVVPYTDSAGRRREKWLSASSRDEADRLRREFLRTLARGVTVEGLALTVGAHVATWLATRQDLSPASRDRYRHHLEARIEPTLGDVPLGVLSPGHVRAAMDAWSGSASTRSSTFVVLRSALRSAIDDRLIVDDPTRGLRSPRIVDAAPTVLDVEGAELLRAAVAGDRLAGLIDVFLGLGLRRGEALGIREVDVDLAGGLLRVSKSLRPVPRAARGEDEAHVRLVAPKAGSDRAIPLPAFVAEALRARIDALPAERRAARPYAPNGLVFCRPNGEPLAFTSVDRWFKAALVRAKLPDMRLHELRHSAATILLAEGVPERTVQAILGHQSGEMTRRYMTVLPRVSRDAADRLDRAIGH
jgi:integrase